VAVVDFLVRARGGPEDVRTARVGGRLVGELSVRSVELGMGRPWRHKVTRGCSQVLVAGWIGDGGRGLTPCQLMPGKRLEAGFRSRETRLICGVTAAA
jgi:hypothetical protein